MSDDLGNVSMMVHMNQFDRPTVQVDANLQFSDLSAEPVIESEAATSQVRTCSYVCEYLHEREFNKKRVCLWLVAQWL